MYTTKGPTEYVTYDLLLSFIHRISSVVFIGKEFYSSPVWSNAVSSLPVDVEITKFILLPLPALLRRFIAPLIPQRNRIFRQRAAVRDLLFPSGRVIVREEPSIMKLLIEHGKETDPARLTARLMILTGAAVR